MKISKELNELLIRQEMSSIRLREFIEMNAPNSIIKSELNLLNKIVNQANKEFDKCVRNEALEQLADALIKDNFQTLINDVYGES